MILDFGAAALRRRSRRFARRPRRNLGTLRSVKLALQHPRTFQLLAALVAAGAGWLAVVAAHDPGGALVETWIHDRPSTYPPEPPEPK